MSSMPKPPTPQVRQGGGFNNPLGGFGDEHLDENAMQAAMQQKAASQQASDPATMAAAAQKQATTAGPGAKPAQPPRELGSITDELIKRPARDIVKQLASFFDLNRLLGINPADTPEKQAKKKSLHQRWSRLNQEQQQVAQANYKKRLEEKQRAEQEEQIKKQQAAEAKQRQAIAPPASPKKGPVGPGMSGKQKAKAQLEQDRQRMPTPQGAN